MVVIHYTAMDSCTAARDRLCDPAAEVSAHYLIGPDGAVLALVPEALRAWHAGAGRWGDVEDVNSRSIGIELANRGNHPFAAAQMDALERLLAGIMDRWTMAPERIIGHSDMAPARKRDPGPRFDWRRLARQGLSVWPTEVARDAGPGDLAAFVAAAMAFGYDGGLAPQVLLDAFRQRFGPWTDGAGPTAAETALIADLARRFPVDRADPDT